MQDIVREIVAAPRSRPFEQPAQILSLFTVQTFVNLAAGKKTGKTL